MLVSQKLIWKLRNRIRNRIQIHSLVLRIGYFLDLDYFDPLLLSLAKSAQALRNAKVYTKGDLGGGVGSVNLLPVAVILTCGYAPVSSVTAVYLGYVTLLPR